MRDEHGARPGILGTGKCSRMAERNDLRCRIFHQSLSRLQLSRAVEGSRAGARVQRGARFGKGAPSGVCGKPSSRQHSNRVKPLPRFCPTLSEGRLLVKSADRNASPRAGRKRPHTVQSSHWPRLASLIGRTAIKTKTRHLLRSCSAAGVFEPHQAQQRLNICAQVVLANKRPAKRWPACWPIMRGPMI